MGRVDVDYSGIRFLLYYLFVAQIDFRTAGRLDKKVESNVTTAEAGVH